MEITTISKLRSKISHYMDLVLKDSSVLIIPRGGKNDNAVVMISLDEYNALNETSYLLSTKANRDRLMESIAQAENGKNMVDYNPENFKIKEE